MKMTYIAVLLAVILVFTGCSSTRCIDECYEPPMQKSASKERGPSRKINVDQFRWMEEEPERAGLEIEEGLFITPEFEFEEGKKNEEPKGELRRALEWDEEIA